MDLNELGAKSAGIWGWVGGGGLVAVATAALKFRTWLSKDGVDRRKDAAEKSIIDSLSEERDAALARASEAEKRADAAFQERNDTIREIGQVNVAMARMEERLRQLSELNEKQNIELSELRNQVQNLREKLNEQR